MIKQIAIIWSESLTGLRSGERGSLNSASYLQHVIARMNYPKQSMMTKYMDCFTFVRNCKIGKANDESAGYVIKSLLTLPAAGNRNNNTGQLNNRGNNGNYWSSTVNNSNNGYNMNFNNGNVNATNNNNRTNGFSVRCVSEFSNSYFILNNLYMRAKHLLPI